jgi:regulator of protease activity HflC (stomatin/prohibitin superfamily)
MTIFAVIVIPLSLKSLEQGRYALLLNWSTQKIDEQVVTEPGLKMIGMGNMLVEYPSTFQNMYFVDDSRIGTGSEEDIKRGAVRARSADGLEMRVSVSFQWKLEPPNLIPLYEILGGGIPEESFYRDEFVRFARGALVHASSKFTANMYFTNRTTITGHMFELVQDAFNQPEKGLRVSIKGLQLREVTLPALFDEEILKTQEQMQEMEVALAERNEQVISMRKDLAVMEENVQTLLEEARGTAGETLKINEADVNQKLVLEEATANANAQILENLEAGTAQEAYTRLFEIMQVGAIDTHKSDKLVMDI